MIVVAPGHRMRLSLTYPRGHQAVWSGQVHAGKPRLPEEWRAVSFVTLSPLNPPDQGELAEMRK